MFFTSLLPIELWMKIYSIEHTMIQANVLNELKELSYEIEELNDSIKDKNEKWNLIKWNKFKKQFSNIDFYGRCQIESFKYFKGIPKNHSCSLCQLPSV